MRFPVSLVPKNAFLDDSSSQAIRDIALQIEDRCRREWIISVFIKCGFLDQKAFITGHNDVAVLLLATNDTIVLTINDFA